MKAEQTVRSVDSEHREGTKLRSMVNVLVRPKLHVLLPRSELAEFNIPRPFGFQKVVGASARLPWFMAHQKLVHVR
jgi:hypothetical protein